MKDRRAVSMLKVLLAQNESVKLQQPLVNELLKISDTLDVDIRDLFNKSK